jgi:hypothetical protein
VKKVELVFCMLLFSALACKALAPGQPLQGEDSAMTALPNTATSGIATPPPVSPVAPTGTLLPVDTVLPATSPSLPTETMLPTEIAPPTETALPTDTPQPTVTPTPTHTATPTVTPTIAQYPIVYSGSGAKVLEIDKWPGPAIVRITHTGQSYFTVESFDNNLRHVAYLVDVIGNYSGTVPIDFEKNNTKRVTINADGTWGIQILPLSSVEIVTVPGTVTGKGNSVFALVGEKPDKIIVDASQASGNFLIQVYNLQPALVYLASLVNDTAPFTGVYMAPNGASLLTITASGPWKLEITGQ